MGRAGATGQGPVLVILGPTAVGKTTVAIAVARHLDAEIISADSRAFFRGLEVATDQPTREQRAAIPHHLIDCVPIAGAYDAMAFRRDVVRLVPEIRARGHVPLIVGGGTLYLGALLRGLFDGPSNDASLRSRMAERSVEELHRELREVDSTAALAIHPNDRLRIERALEVYRVSGRRISEWQTEATPLPYRFVVVGLERERHEHRETIAARVRRMIAEGLIEEFEHLRLAGITPECQAYRTIGIPEAEAYAAGEITVEEMEQRIANRTWQLARRQSAWFRREQDVRWIDVSGRSVDIVADDVITLWNQALEGE